MVKNLCKIYAFKKCNMELSFILINLSLLQKMFYTQDFLILQELIILNQRFTWKSIFNFKI